MSVTGASTIRIRCGGDYARNSENGFIFILPQVTRLISSRAGVDLRSLLILPVRVSQPTVYSMLMAQALHKLHSLILIHCFCTLECRSFADGGFMFVHRGMFASFMLEPL